MLRGLLNIYRNNKHARIAILALSFFSLFLVVSLLSIFVLYQFFGISSSNAVLYYIKDDDGWIKVTNDLRFDQVDKLILMIDASSIFRFFEGVASSTYNEPVIELSWNKKEGHGVIKEFRPDGTEFLVVLARFEEEEGIPQGIFVGGDLAFGDSDRRRDRNRSNTGMAFYDGNQWFHIWCSINEALHIEGIEDPVYPWQWEYLGSRVVKSTASEVFLQSMHVYDSVTENADPVKLLMSRSLYKKSGDDYITLKVEYSNIGGSAVFFNYYYGDEPWVGKFGNSEGDVGWTKGRLIKQESYILPDRYKFAGYWDYGNDLAGEDHTFTGYANFVEWLFNPPTLVYFANTFSLSDVLENRILDSQDNRVINLVWLSEVLKPGDSKSYSISLGMAKPDPFTGLPVKPEVNILGSGRSIYGG